MTHLEDLVKAIEESSTQDNLREEYLSKLNIYGYKEEDIKQEARTHWRRFFEENLKELLKSKQPIESHILDEEEVKGILEIVFKEFQARRKDLGIDDIRKYWFPV
ncbi:MAG: hypothetical protein JXR19_05290 [Bacteroidia bacterium]